MDPNAPVSAKPYWKNPFAYYGLILVVIAAYVVFVLLSRYESNRAFERRNAQQQSQQRREDDRTAIEQLGGSELSIRAMYISPAVIHRGDSAQLCYDVTNAKTVILDPPEGEVWPSHTRCLPLSPKKTTTYTLTIADAVGKTASQSVELQVK